jgi:hypothetical protein
VNLPVNICHLTFSLCELPTYYVGSPPLASTQRILTWHLCGPHTQLQTLRTEVLPHGEAGVNLPVNIRRLILNAQTKFNIKPHRPGYTNLTPMDIVKKVSCALLLSGCSLHGHCGCSMTLCRVEEGVICA